MKIFFKHIITPRLGLLALLLLLCSSGMYAQTTDPKYIDDVLKVGAGEIVEWHGDVEIAATAQITIEDGAKIYFYGNTLTIHPGATISGTSDWATFNAGTGTGRIIFQKPNTIDNSNNQQVLIGGNAGSTTTNTIPTIEINNANGVKLSGSNARIGSGLIFTSGHLYVDVQTLALSSTATITGADQNKFVVTASTGFLAKEGLGATAFAFPVGSSDVAGDYLPAVLQNSGTADKYNVRAISTLTPAPGSNASAYLTRSWQITEATAGGSKVTLGLQHNTASNQGTTYVDATAKILTSPAAAGWKAASTNATGQATGTVAGSSLHTVTGVTDFSTNTYFTKGPVTPDYTTGVLIDALNFTDGASSDIVVQISELANQVNTSPVAFRVAKGPNFTISYNAATTTANVLGGIAVNNADWTVTDNGTYFLCTLKAGKTISGYGSSLIGFTVTRNAATVAEASQNLTATIVAGSGGDANNANNSSVKTITAL